MAVNSFREDENIKESMKVATLLRLFKYLLAYKKKIIAVLFIMAVTISINMVNPLIIERAIDVHIANKDIDSLLKLGLCGLLINVIYIIGTKLRMYIMAKVTNTIILEIREELYVHIQKLSFTFFDSRPTGKVLARIIGDVNSLKDVLTDSVTTLIPSLLTIISVVAIMVIKNTRLAMAALITVPFLAVSMYIIQEKTHLKWQVTRKKVSNLSAYIHEQLSGMRIVQSFTAEEEAYEDFKQLTKEHEMSFCNCVKWVDCFSALIEVSWGIGVFFLYFIGIKIIGVGEIGAGTFIAFSTYISMFWSPIRNLANFYNKLISNISAAERVFEIMDTEPEICDDKKVGILPEIEGRVEFEHVSFAYSDEPDIKVLKDVNFEINPGETIALVGPTGAGKTTIVNLISRFYDIKEGRILVDGHSVKDVTIESLRHQMGVMTQDNFLFSGTIKDNIKYGRLDASDEDVISAAKAVHAHDFIMRLENGYDTEITERGQGLSIGQRQLIAFARTMLSMPRILILDEATSSIDTHTETLVQKGIEALLQDRTSFVIAHRLSTIKNADRIFVINNGNIQEAGSHDELMERRGEYYNLYQAQFRAIGA